MAIRTTFRLIATCPHLSTVPNSALRGTAKITKRAYQNNTFNTFFNTSSKKLLESVTLPPRVNVMSKLTQGVWSKQPILEQMFESWCFSMGENVFKDLENILDGKTDQGYHTLRPFINIMAWTSRLVGQDFGDDPTPQEAWVPASSSGNSLIKHLWTVGSTLNDRLDISEIASGLFEMAKQHVQVTVNRRIEALKEKYPNDTKKWTINLEHWENYLDTNSEQFKNVCKDVLSPIVKNLQTYACQDSPKQSQNSDSDFETEMENIKEIFDKGVNDMKIQIQAYNVKQESFLNLNVDTENEFLEKYKDGFSKYFVSMAINTTSAQLLEAQKNIPKE